MSVKRLLQTPGVAHESSRHILEGTTVIDLGEGICEGLLPDQLVLNRPGD